MAYATIAQFVEAYTEREAVALTNSDDPAAEYVNQISLQRALDDATAEIDSYLSGRYSLPFASAPKVLTFHCLNIARYRLSMVAPGEDVRKRYEDTLKFLAMLAKGDVSLGIAADDEQIIDAGSPSYATTTRVWTDDTLRDF